MQNRQDKLLRSAALFVLALSCYSHSVEYGQVSVKRVVSIYDADTFRADIFDWPDIVGKNIGVRVNGIDAPEIRGECAKEKEMAKQAKAITVDALNKAESITLVNVRRGKYFRLLADVYADDEKLSDILLQSGLVRRYSGGKRKGWCG